MIRQCAGHVVYDLVIVVILFLIMSRKKPVQVTIDEVEVDGQGVVDPREEKWYERFLPRLSGKKDAKVSGEKN